MAVFNTRLFVMIGVLSCLSGFRSAQAGFLPDNDLHLQDNVMQSMNITESEFNETIDEVTKFYYPVVKEHGAELKATRDWSDSWVNASANQPSDTEWQINFFGGLARRSEITRDGFALVVCHELGHHLAGFPFKSVRWASAEGECDYFATQSCLREIWATDFQRNTEAGLTVDPTAKELCDVQHESTAQRELCYRISNASYSTALLLSHLGREDGKGKDPSFKVHDTTVVKKTNVNHPAAQCRLDTMMNGDVCKAPFTIGLIPGKETPEGRDSIEAEKEAGMNSCSPATGFTDGQRPACWFKSRL
jgi:hypothetical protein